MQATLPLRFEGLGLQSALESSSAAFLSSCNATRELVQHLLEAESSKNVSTLDSMNLCTTESSFSQTLTLPGEIRERERFSVQLENHIDTDEPAFFILPQKALQSQLDVIQLQSLKDMSSVRDRARLNTISSAYAGAWLRAVPNQNLGLSMLQHEFIIATRIWLGIPLFPDSPDSLRCVCGSIIDPQGDYLLGCGYDSALNRRYNALCDIIWHALLIDNKAARREQTCSSNSKACPSDIFHPDYVAVKHAFFDVTVRNTVQAKYVCEAAEMAEAAARTRELEKDYKHEQSVLKSGGLFYPLALESFRFQTQASLQSLTTIAAKTTTYNGINLQQAFSNLLQQLSVQLWQYNARMIIRRYLLETEFGMWDSTTYVE